ncbi:hypothetical protein [Ferruginibacter albus]|uniref:hypothetical protein n=1 Tax=Ferruginibacter albus TaxID=2875540 RepID=UPI001CC6924C|nr:hypothetical protein [Ferruginibacter albus]UAY52829.1 hypothetical protein K9M53_03910 [Ferruginibacter albus]UAY53102.1 hypothetical protein K9M53_05340 [Ferruginibacter albus]
MNKKPKSLNDEAEELFSFAEFRKFMFETTVPIKELTDKKGKPLEKILAFWRRNELLPFIADGKWAKMSFAQLFWLRILDDLREISFPVDKMKLICNYFFKDAYDNNLPERNIRKNKEEIEKKIIAGTQTQEDEEYFELLKYYLSEPPILYIFKFSINYLVNLIASVIASENDGFIYIFFDGRVAEFIGHENVGHKDFTPDLTEPHIQLSISHYLKEFIRDEDISSLLMPQLLNEDEIKVLREMRRNNIKEITIYRINDKKNFQIQSSKEGILSKEKTLQLKEILGLKNYERITIDTMDEKTLSFKMTRKKI